MTPKSCVVNPWWIRQSFFNFYLIFAALYSKNLTIFIQNWQPLQVIWLQNSVTNFAKFLSFPAINANLIGYLNETPNFIGHTPKSFNWSTNLDYPMKSTEISLGPMPLLGPTLTCAICVLLQIVGKRIYFDLNLNKYKINRDYRSRFLLTSL